MQYTVRTSQGSAVTVVTDQTQVRVGDWVAFLTGGMKGVFTRPMT